MFRGSRNRGAKAHDTVEHLGHLRSCKETQIHEQAKSIRDQRSDRWSNHIQSISHFGVLRREGIYFKIIIPAAVLKMSCRKIKVASWRPFGKVLQ